MMSGTPDDASAAGSSRAVRLLAGFAALASIAAVLLLPALTPWLLRIEHWTADWRNALLADRALHSNEQIAIVSITDATLRDVNKSPIDRKLLARIVRAVDAAGPRAIGLDVLFFQKTDPAADSELTEALKTAAAKVVVGAADERAQLEPFQREFQASYLAGTGRPAGYLNIHHDPDNVVRFASLPAAASAFPKSFARQLAEAAGTSATDSGRPISWLDDAKDGTPAFFTLPAHDLLADHDLGTRLKDRIVLIGGDFALRDRHRVPLTVLTGELMPGVTIHAQMLAPMLEPSRKFSELGLQKARFLLVALGLVGFALGWQLGNSRIAQYASWGVMTAILLAIDAICYRELRLVLPFTLAAVAWFAGLMAGRFLRTGLHSTTAPERRSPT